jgi:16S rRNA (uracil1498-N3)-methyltransferase
VTAPLFFADADRLRAAAVGDVIELDGAEGHHAATVRRISVGERLELADGAGLVWLAEVTAVQARSLHARLLERRDTHSARPSVTVVQALAKGDRDERAVETMTEVGVDLIVPWEASRSVVRWDADRAAKGVARWRSTAREAAKQARRPVIPTISELASTAHVVARVREVAASVGGLAVVLHESAQAPLTSVLSAQVAAVMLVIGPEGGISDDELGAFEAAGAALCRLGPTVLRTSTAGTVAAAVVMANSGRWAVG